jgi:hypothetical protein
VAARPEHQRNRALQETDKDTPPWFSPLSKSPKIKLWLRMYDSTYGVCASGLVVHEVSVECGPARVVMGVAAEIFKFNGDNVNGIIDCSRGNFNILFNVCSGTLASATGI